MTTETPTVKGAALRLVEQLPDDANWDDVLYQVCVAQAVEAGLKDCRQGRTIPVGDLRRRFGLHRGVAT